MLEKNKNYFEENKQEIYQKNTEYRIKNSERLKEQKRKYYKDNKEKILSTKDKDKIKQYNKIYFEKNKNILNKKRKVYVRNRKIKDKIFRLENIIRPKIVKLLKKKNYDKKSSIENILGCSFIELKEYIEKQWESWMNWDNYGAYNGEYNYGWDIDHIMELKTASNEEELLKLNHHSNLRPLDSKINRVDRNKIL